MLMCTPLINLLRYGCREGVKVFVLISTGAVYGMASHPRRESEALEPSNFYSCAKAAGEFVARGYVDHMRVYLLRLFYPYGPGQRLPRVVPRLIDSILHGRPIMINGEEGRPPHESTVH